MLWSEKNSGPWRGLVGVHHGAIDVLKLGNDGWADRHQSIAWWPALQPHDLIRVFEAEFRVVPGQTSFGKSTEHVPSVPQPKPEATRFP